MTRVFSFGESSLEVPEVTCRFDYYSASLAEDVEGDDAVDYFVSLDLGVPTRSVGNHGYATQVDFMAGKRRVVQVSYGGSQKRPLVVASGASTDRVVELVRRRWPDHRVTRVDAALDWDDPAAWATTTGAALDLARRRGIKTSVQGDWLDAVDGRTLYLGGRASGFRTRIYEKGLQMSEAGRPAWVRAECQWRPDRAQKLLAARLTPLEVWGGSRWGRELLEALSGLSVAPIKGQPWTPPDDLRARNALLKQYGRTITAWANEVGGFDVLAQILEDELRAPSPSSV